MGIWHQNYDALEIHGSRVEQWNDKSPQCTVVLQVEQGDLYGFTNAIMRQRTAWPWNSDGLVGVGTAPFNVYVSNVEILPINTQYVGASGNEAITTGETRRVRVTYKNNTAFEMVISTSIGTGTATDYGFETQTVWTDVVRKVETEFLRMDYNDFSWEPREGVASAVDTDYDPLLPDEAPGFPVRTVTYIRTYYNIFLTQDIEDSIYLYSGTVNNSQLTASYGLLTFEEDQVLFEFEELKPSNRDGSVPTGKTLHDLKLSFKCRLGESTWNKFFRAATNDDGDEDTSGWYNMYHKPRTEQSGWTLYKPYERTSLWYPLWYEL